MDIRIQSALLAAIVGLALGISVLLRGERPRVLTLYAWFAIAVAGFFLFEFFRGVAVPATWGDRLSLGGTLVLGALVPSAALSFFLEFLGVSPGAHRNGRRVAWLSAFFGLTVG